MNSLLYSSLFSLHTWLSLAEIIIFSALFYYISRWLNLDQKTHLLRYFYGYCLFILLSAWAPLPLLYSALTNFAPVSALLFILFHQETLQKNFITLCRYMPAQKTSFEWLQALIRLALINRNNGINLRIIIEHNETLDNILTNPFKIEAPFQEDLLAALIMSQAFEQEKFIWLRYDGSIVSININLTQHQDDIWKEEKIQLMPQWKQDALLISTKTDAFIIATDMAGSSFTIITNGTVLSEISAENVLKIIKKHMNVVIKSKGTQYYECKKSHEKQQPHS